MGAMSRGEDRYFSDFNKSEGIHLDIFAIRPNPAKLGLAKLCLYSMWGKLTKGKDRTITKMISEPQEIYRFLATPGIEVAKLMFNSDDVVWANGGLSLRKRFRAYVTQMRLSVPMSQLERGFIYTAISTDCNRERCISTLTAVYIQPKDEPTLVETGDWWLCRQN